MSRLLSDILQAREPEFTLELRRLESLAAHPKVDIRLHSELANLRREVAADMELDESDTEARELYFALRQRLQHENDRLSEELGIKPNESVESVVEKCVRHVTPIIHKQVGMGCKK